MYLSSQLHLIRVCVCGTCVYMVHMYIQKTKSGLYIPEKAQDKVNIAKVVAVGPGRMTEVS